MQCGLVDDRAREDGCAVVLVGEAQPVKPDGPSGLKVPLEADFVASGLVMIVGRGVSSLHVVAFVLCFDYKVRTLG